jgi:hypothetical protein
MTLVKEDLIESLYNQADLSRQESKALLEAVFELIKKALEQGIGRGLEATEGRDKGGVGGNSPSLPSFPRIPIVAEHPRLWSGGIRSGPGCHRGSPSVPKCRRSSEDGGVGLERLTKRKYL